MDLSQVKDYEFLLSVGVITMISSIATLIFTQIIKLILKNKKVIYQGMEESKKDTILSRIGRVIALATYTAFYLGSEMYLKHTITFNIALFTGLLSGATLTLTLAKGIYTMLHQWSQKKNIYERLAYKEKVCQELSQILSEVELIKTEDSKSKNKWTLTNKKKNKE